MNRIDRLLKQAKKERFPVVHHALCIIKFDSDIQKWTADPKLWDGVPGSGFLDTAIPLDWKREYNTAEEATEAVNKFFSTLSISDPVVLIIDDMGV